MANNQINAQQQNEQQNLTILKLYSSYRVLLASALLFSFFFFIENRIVGNLKPVLFLYATSLYLIINIISAGFILARKKHLKQQQLFSYFFIDILAIIAIADSTGGVKSGLAILLVVIIAGSSILLKRQLATLMAAFASVFLLADTFRLIEQHHLDSASFFPTGILGIVLFATSFFIQPLAQRIRKSQLEAVLSATEAQRQQQLNQLIVQRMQTGIIVAQNTGSITTCNQAAIELLSDNYNEINISSTLPQALLEQMHSWLNEPRLRNQPFKVSPSGAELQANFSALENERETLIFLEDNRLIAQRAQDIKLASLGRLTASIAHEIRNPLSAISHAAQLLNESPALDKADLRLSTIIQKHCLRMNQIIENILQLSRRTAPSPETININEWIKTYIDEFVGEHPDAKIHLKLCEQDCLTTVDCSQLSQILINIMENGLRYSHKKTGIATLTIESYLDKQSSLPCLTIIDDGDGVSPEQRTHLFEPFYTTENTGTGLGLFIAREMCEANQTRLNYFINNDNRSCFNLSFPHHEKRLFQTSPQH